MIRVELVHAWPRRHESRVLELPDGATLQAALEAAGIDTPVAVFGERLPPSYVLREGDRIEVLRPLLADPKDARRRRASRGTTP